MIIGIGSDLVDIRRIEKLYSRFEKKFEERVFTDDEIRTANKCNSGINAKFFSLAKRFAAKEACAKALGIGIGQGIKWTDISVVNNASGAPYLILAGKAAEHLQRLTPKNTKVQLNLSLSDEYPMALAFVVISAFPL